MMEKESIVIGKLICEYVEQPDSSCSCCDLKGCKECVEAQCQDELNGKYYILKIVEGVKV